MGLCCSTVGERRGGAESKLECAEPSSSASPHRSRRQRWQKIGSRRESGGGEGEVHGRMFMNGASEAACLYTQQGKKGTNQDAMIVWENFSSRSDTIFCGVFDGHGPYGHMVAKKVRDTLPAMMCTQWKGNCKGDLSGFSETGNEPECINSEETASLSVDDECYESLEVGENGKVPEMYRPLKQSFLKAFKQMDKDLKLNPVIDCFCSGSTAVTLVKQGPNLILGNVGDSRAVLATRDNENSLIAVQLTVDLKPDLPREAARIRECKGRVFALQDEPEVARVWLPNNDSPGLAMSRAFGDFCLKDFGLISVPDIYYRQLTERDEFIILATDGVWDVLSNKEAVDVVSSAPGRATAARALVDTAVRAWRLKYPTSKNDDCAVVCLFIKRGSVAAEAQGGNNLQNNPEEGLERVAVIGENDVGLLVNGESNVDLLERSGSLQGCDEIEPVLESTEEKFSSKSPGQSVRSLAECLSTAEDEEWSALEGITRVNSLLSVPRFLSGDKRSTSWRKWL